MYRAPLRELRFVIEELLGAAQLASCPGLAEYSDELAVSVLEEAARFAQSVLDPLNKPGDTQGARWTPDGVVTAPPSTCGDLPDQRWSLEYEMVTAISEWEYQYRMEQGWRRFGAGCGSGRFP